MEIWKSIPGWEGYYSVSNIGRVRSEKRTIIDSRTKSSYVIPEKILKPAITNTGKGYYRVSLSKKSKIKFADVHRLVAWAFIGKQEHKMEVRHLDGNCKNNRIENIAYGTKSQNIQDAKKHGTFPLYEKRPGALLNREIVKDIVKSKLTNSELSRKYNVHPGTIRQIRIGETWGIFTEKERQENPYKFKERKC